MPRWWSAVLPQAQKWRLTRVLFDLAKEINRYKSSDSDKANAYAAILRSIAAKLGLLYQDPEQFLQGGQQEEGGITDEAIDDLIQKRTAAREARDWAESDRIRDLLKSEGVVLEDSAGVTRWRRE